MENLLQNILEMNMNENNNKKEILLIGDIWDYRERMSKNFIRFLDYLKDNLSKYKLIYYGTGVAGFQKGMSLNNIIKNYCNEEKPIVWICDVRGPTMTSKINEYEGIKIYDYEDIVGKMDEIINEVNRNKYQYVFYKYDCPETEKIKYECKNAYFYRYEHFIDENMYKDWGLSKEIDILCYGCIWWGYYPFRKRLFELFIKQKDLKVIILNHPTYGYKNERQHEIIDEELSKLINKSNNLFLNG
jgi:hypothetical protein